MLQALRAASTRLQELTGALPAEAQVWCSAPESWNAVQTVTHLAAAEGPFRQRLARIVEEDCPWLPYFGPDVARPDEHVPLPRAVAGFQAAREQLVQFLLELPAEAWTRPAVHETLGATTLAQQVQNIINHDQEHLSQLAALSEAWRQQSHV